MCALVTGVQTCALPICHRRVQAALTREITHIERDIQRCLASADASALKATVDLLSQTPGIATVISATVSANLPELGHCSRRAICALAGVAPIANDSGKHPGQRDRKSTRLNSRPSRANRKQHTA